MLLQIRMDKTARKIDSITKKMEELKNAKVEDTTKWKRLRCDIDATKVRIQTLTEKAREMRNVQIPTDEYKEIQSHLESNSKEFDKMLEKQEKMQALGQTSGKGWDSLQYTMETLGRAIEADKIDLQNLVDEGQAFSNQKGTDAYKAVKEDLQAAYEEMRRLKAEEKNLEAAFNSDKTAGIDKLTGDLGEANANMELTKLKLQQIIEKEKQMNTEGSRLSNIVGKSQTSFKKLSRTAGQASDKVKRMAKESTNANKGFTNLVRTMKQMVLSMAVFTVMQKGLEFLGSGLRNLAVYSKEYNKSMSELISSTSQLKNSFAVAFEPILNMVIPILSQLVSHISAAANAVSRFFAILGGKSTYTKAIKQNKNYADALDKVGGSADEAKGSLAGFDDLDVLQKCDTGSGGGAATDGADSSGFIEEAVGDTSKFEDIKSALKEIVNIFKTGFTEGLGDWQSHLSDIHNKTLEIKKALQSIFTDPGVASGASEFAETLTYNLGVVAGSVTSIGTTIAQNLVGGIALYLQEDTPRIKQYLVNMFDIGTEIAGLAGSFSSAFAYVFEAFGQENGQQLTANLLGMFTGAFTGVSELCGRLIRDILNIIIQPFVDNKEEFRTALDGFLGTASSVCGTIKDTINDTFDKLSEVYDEHIKPFFDSIETGVSNLQTKFLEFWNTYVQPVLDEMAIKFDEVMGEHIQPMIDALLEFIGGIIDNLTYLWEEVLKPLIDWIVVNVLPKVMPIISALGNGVLKFVGFVSDLITILLGVLQGVIDFVVGVFAGDWDKAWEGIKKIFSSVWDGIKKVLDNILGKIWDKITGVLNSIGIEWDMSWEDMKKSIVAVFEGIVTKIRPVVNNIITVVETMVNSVINAINGMINALNGISFMIPDWVPVLGGKSFPSLGLSTIKNISIPKLANGGITTGSTLANIGEAGREAVLPLENNTGWMDDLADKLAARMPSYGTPTRIVMELDGKEFARGELPYFNVEAKRIGVELKLT